MLKVISSKNESEVYKLARVEKDRAKIAPQFSDCSLDEAVINAENISIFGDKEAYFININGLRGVNEENLEKLNEKFLTILLTSEHFFVIVGSGVEFEKRIEEEGKKLKLKPLKIIEKVFSDFPSDLVAAIQKHDKKNTWGMMLRELNKNDGEKVHGSCIFAFKTLCVYLNDTAKNSLSSGVKDYPWKQAAANARLGKREKQEVADKYFNLVLAYHNARSGKGDMKTQLEKWVLEN